METQNGQLERILKLTEENNKILKGMRNRHNLSTFMRLIYIGLIVYASYWGYKQLMPYMDQLKSLTQQVAEISKTAENAKSSISPELLKLLEKLPK